jgi:cytochrome c biogenesis protein CcmG/thiol:disulfide interchange protein DsbE
MRHISTILIVILLLTGCSAAREAAPTPGIPLPANVAWDSRVVDGSGPGTIGTGDVAPDFTYTAADGSTHRLSELRGKVVIVNFWATWCIPCRQEMPDLQKIADERGGTIVVLGVNKLEALEAIVPFAKELGVGFTLITNPSGDISESYGIRNLPTTFFIKADGTVGEWKLGGVRYTEAEQILTALGE